MQCLRCTFEFSERKLEGLDSFSPTSMLWEACPRDSQPYVRERLCWLPFSLAFSLCSGEHSNLPTAAVCFGTVLLLWGWRRWERSKPPGPTRGCLFSLPKLHWGETSSLWVMQWWAQYQSWAKHSCFQFGAETVFEAVCFF